MRFVAGMLLTSGRAGGKADQLRLVYSKLDELLVFLDPLLPLANSCMVNFITESLWDQLVPAQLGTELLQLPRPQLLQLPAAQPALCPAADSSRSLHTLLSQLAQLQLTSSGLLTAPPQPATTPPPPLLDHCFSGKKSHEVERLAETVAHLAAAAGTSQVVDVGSGRGYLSSLLTLGYGLDVTAVEGNTVHSGGAQKVNENLKKSWDAIVSRSEALRAGHQPEKRSRKWKRKQASREVEVPLPGRLSVVDCYIGTHTRLSDLVSQTRPTALVGLHTCGDLAVHSINMFTQLSQVRLLVNVGCCYHLQRERFEGRFWADLDPADITFPLSAPLLRRRCTLGQNARGLAAQATERMAHMQREPSPSLFYRAVLQAYLADKLGTVPTDINVGRLARKARDYLDYMHMALSKYPIRHKEIPDSELMAYHDRYLGQKTKLEAFSILRACLAPVVEAVILLDRLAFLLEQEEVGSAELVQLFNPVTSPRCYALLATKR